VAWRSLSRELPAEWRCATIHAAPDGPRLRRRLRAPPAPAAVFQLVDATVAAYRAARRDRGFTDVFTPKIVATATESRCQLLPSRLFRPAGPPRAEPAAVQASPP